MRTSIQTISRSTFRCIFFFEICQISKRADLRTGASCQPQKNIHIMAAFLQNHRTCFITASPVSPHKAVGMMPVANLFNMLNTDQSSKAIFLNKIFNPGEKGRIPQNMTDHQDPSIFFCHISHSDNFRSIRRHRFFTEYMISFFQSLCYRFKMHGILCTDKSTVCHFFLFQ